MSLRPPPKSPPPFGPDVLALLVARAEALAAADRSLLLAHFDVICKTALPEAFEAHPGLAEAVWRRARGEALEPGDRRLLRSVRRPRQAALPLG